MKHLKTSKTWSSDCDLKYVFTNSVFFCFSENYMANDIFFSKISEKQSRKSDNKIMSSKYMN